MQNLYREQDEILRDLWLLKESKKIGIQSLQHGNGLSLTSETLMCTKRSQFHEQQGGKKQDLFTDLCIKRVEKKGKEFRLQGFS